MNKEAVKEKLAASMAHAKPKLDEASVKAKAALSEIKANFKADEGATGVKKVQSMFINLWKSGKVGKGALIAAGVIAVLLTSRIFVGGGSAGDDYVPKNVPEGMLVVKGLYMRQPGDDALKACQRIAESDAGLVVIDFRKGITWEKDDPGRIAAEKQYESAVARARTNVVLRANWNRHHEIRSQMFKEGKSSQAIEKAGYCVYEFYDYKEKFEKDCRPELADEKEVKSWLDEHGWLKPGDIKIAPKRLIKVAVKKDGVSEDELESLLNVWIDKEDRVSEVYVVAKGLDRIFNAGDLSGSELGQSLVDNYDLIPTLDCEVKISGSDGEVTAKTWKYKSPAGFQVTLYDAVVYESNIYRRDLDVRDYGRIDKGLDPNGLIELFMSTSGVKRYLSITAIKAASERKFD